VPDMQIILTNELSKIAAQTSLSLEGLVSSMRNSGMSNEAIKQTLVNDLTSGGRLFGNFRNQIKNTVKNGVEMSGNNGSMGTFENAGVTEYQWISVGDKSVCIDCEERHKATGTKQYFETIGMPKSGFSICQQNCRCQVLPSDYKGENLDKPLLKKQKENVERFNMAGKHKTVKDSFKWMKAQGVVNNGFKNLSLDYANAITEAISRIPEKFRKNVIIGNFAYYQKAQGRKFRSRSGHNYGVSGELSAIDSMQSKIKEIAPSFQEAKRDALHILDPKHKPLPHYHVIGFNTRKYKTLKEITDSKIAVNEKWFKKYGRNYNFNFTGEATVHHEFGHYVQKKLSSEQVKKWDSLATKWIKKDPTDYLKRRDMWEFHSEAWAEAWAAYQTGQKSRLPNDIIKFIEEIQNT